VAPATGAKPGAEDQGTGPGATGDGFAFPGQIEGEPDV
jgi:hypothetical protein